MPALSTLALLDVWERGLDRSPARQAVLLVEATCPQLTADSIGGLSIGERDRILLAVREAMFGSHLVAAGTCPGCGEELESSFDVADLRVEPPPARGHELVTRVGAFEVTFRCPQCSDVVDGWLDADVEGARRALLEGCIVAASHAGEPTPVRELPSEVVNEIVRRMGDADPQADIRVALECPVCRHGWEAAFDIVSFVWHELTAWAWRLLADVTTLASAFGWREADILSLTPGRRRLYLELASR